MAQRRRNDELPPPLHEVEAEVMEEIWSRDEASVREVLEALNRGRKKRAYTTVMTVMARLYAKGLLDRRRSGKTDIYSAVLSEEEYRDRRARAEVEEVLEEYGDVAIAHFARRVGGLDAKRLEKLRSLAEDE
jgi:predicted transcriptional regulator